MLLTLPVHVQFDPAEPVKFLHREQLKTAVQSRNQRLLKPGMQMTTLAPIELYLAPPPSSVDASTANPTILVFVKLYDPVRAELTLLEAKNIPESCAVSRVAEWVGKVVAKSMGLAETPHIDIFDEVCAVRAYASLLPSLIQFN